MSTTTFSNTFQSPYRQYADRIGQPFTVVGEPDPLTYDAEEAGVMYEIRFSDGEQIAAWPEEVDLRVIADVAIRQGIPYVEAS